MYLAFEEYKTLGGKLTDESTFINLEKRAEIKLDAMTFNRLRTGDLIPNEVKIVLTDFIDMMETFSSQEKSAISNYSNGSESVSYKIIDEAQMYTKFRNKAQEYLANTGLLYRGGGRLDI